MRTFLAALAVVLAPLSVGRADEPTTTKEPENVVQARMLVEAQVRKLGGPQPAVAGVLAADVEKAFPKVAFVSVRYRQWPVAIAPPEGLHSSNVYAVEGEQLTLLKETKDLEAFFRKHLSASRDPRSQVQSAGAWLALQQELVQDGFYKFAIQPGADSEGVARRESLVTSGGNGKLAVALVFADGRLTRINATNQVRPGPRPRCHATLLLDPNPLVRRIVEDDLLIMGLAARDYLREQRARATPQLQREIDRVWRQIEENGW